MNAPWTLRGEPDQQVAGLVTLLEGSTFCISGTNGDIHPGHAQGMFVRDTRCLSLWRLSVDDCGPEPLVVDMDVSYQGAFVCRVPPHTGADSNLLVIRSRKLFDGMTETLSVRNTSGRTVKCEVALAIDADFADLFEVKDGRAGPVLDVTRSVQRDGLVLGRERGGRIRQLTVRDDRQAQWGADGARWQMQVEPHGVWSVRLQAFPSVSGSITATRRTGSAPGGAARRVREWRRGGPSIRTDDSELAAVLQRSIDDLGSLRIFDPEHPSQPVLAAGAPWFMALFGRDSLLASWMLLPLHPRLAISTLQTLAAYQGRTTDAATEEQPGRILHELRFGPATTRELSGGAYYGSIDATPLFVMLLGEFANWTVGADSNGLDGPVRELLPAVDAALDWIVQCGDKDGDGFLEYERSSVDGLMNQGWKDSWNGITFADGRIARPPIALAEVQGYAYAAYLARARLAGLLGDTSSAADWTQRATRLKDAFNERFWLEDRGWYALGLDRHKRPIDSLASNMGHCLWTGIIAQERAPSVAEKLLSPELFSGWGIRTLASSMAAYNPMSYHNGSVWPHDNAICAAGLLRYGFVDAGQEVALAVLDAASHFGHRLPELYCGFDRQEYPGPVPYPTSCSPQAWASAAPLLMLRSLLRLDPEAGGGVWCAPAMPARFLPLRIADVEVQGRTLTVDLEADRWDVVGHGGLAISRTPRPVSELTTTAGRTPQGGSN